MKPQHQLFILFFAFATVNAFAQIPNSGFENWENYTDPAPPNNVYTTPHGWVGGLPTNPGDFGYSIQKITDSYPLSTGQYSMLIESNTTKGIFGIAETGNKPGNAKPTFPITIHPTSLTGYYKFAPLNGDTMQIAVELFKNGSIVSGGVLKSTASISNWTSFNIALSTYTSADSGLIVLSAYNAAGPPPQYVPHGNSALSIDNLNFDNLITTGISEVHEINNFSVYPNPFSSQAILQTDHLLINATLTVYNYYGQIVKEVKYISGQTVTFSRDDLPSGLYFLHLAEGDKTLTVDKLVITD